MASAFAEGLDSIHIHIQYLIATCQSSSEASDPVPSCLHAHSARKLTEAPHMHINKTKKDIFKNPLQLTFVTSDKADPKNSTVLTGSAFGSRLLATELASL